jgi:(hydroxyamino)benzene mutase
MLAKGQLEEVGAFHDSARHEKTSMAQRSIYRHAFVVLAVSFAVGIVAGGVAPDPRARLWLSPHVAGIMTGLLMIAVGVVWPHLRLGATGEKVGLASAIGGNWVGVIVGIFAAVVRFPMKIATPALPDVQGWQRGVVLSGFGVVTISSFVLCGVVLYGLRGAPK